MFFTLQDDTLDMGYVSGYDILGLHLKAKHITLSSCVTGVGRKVGNEGIFSLAVGFFYAGVPSALMTLRPVHDYTTKKIMVAYYQNLEDGFSKTKALQQAKIDFLNNNKDILTGHPGYWSGYMLIGDTQPLFKQGIPPIFLWLIILIIFGLVVRYLYLRFRNYKQR